MDFPILISSRFQPLHKGHLLFIEKVADLFNNNIVICPLKRSNNNILPTKTEKEDKYDQMLEWTYDQINNPLPDDQKISFIKYAVNNHDALRNRVVDIIPRSHPYENWEASLKPLPKRRIWAINSNKSHFDATKIEHYLSKGEHVVCLSFGDFGYRGNEIRESLRRRECNLSFLPNKLHWYFEKHCLRFYEE